MLRASVLVKPLFSLATAKEIIMEGKGSSSYPQMLRPLPWGSSFLRSAVTKESVSGLRYRCPHRRGAVFSEVLFSSFLCHTYPSAANASELQKRIINLDTFGNQTGSNWHWFEFGELVILALAYTQAWCSCLKGIFHMKWWLHVFLKWKPVMYDQSICCFYTAQICQKAVVK